MKILCYSSYFLPYTSGITTSTFQILNHLSKKNQVVLLTFQHDLKLKKQETMGSISVIRMPWNFRVSKGFVSLSSILYFIEQAVSSDVIIINLPNVEALSFAIISKLLRKKLIVLFHCDVEIAGGIFSFMVTQIVRFSAFLQLLLSDTIVTYPDYLSEHWYKDFFKNKLETALPLFEKSTADTKYKNLLLKQKGRKKWVGFIGRIASEKGVEYLIGACMLLKKKRISFELVMAGPEAVGEDEYRAKIIELLKKSDVPHRLLGMISERQLTALYEVLNVVVVPSINQTEAISIVQLEAMTAGTPVVATSMPGVRYPIQQTGMGILVEPKNSPKLASALKNVLNNKKRYANDESKRKLKTFISSKDILKFYNSLLKAS